MKKRKRLFGILLAVVMTVAMMTGCSAGKGGTSGSGVKVGFLACSLEIKGAKSDCRKRKYYPCPESRGMYIDCRCQEIIKQHFHNEQQPIQKNV